MAHEARDRAPGNIFVLDLIARIEIADGSVADAEEALSILDVADVDRQFFPQRMAQFLIDRRGNAEAIKRATALATEAAAARDAPLEALMILARCKIKSNDWLGYRDVKEAIEKKQKTRAVRVLVGLELESAIQRGEWRQAEQLIGRRSGPTASPSQSFSLAQIKASDRSLPLAERKAAEDEVDRLYAAGHSNGAPLVPEHLDLYE